MVKDRFLDMLGGGGAVDDGEGFAVILDAGDIDEGVDSGVIGFELPKNRFGSIHCFPVKLNMLRTS